MFKALITMMDVPTAIGQLAPHMRRLSRGGALLIFACCVLIIGPLTYLWWRFDLSSTIDWFSWLLGTPAAGSLGEAAQQARDVAGETVASTATRAGINDVGMVLLIFGTGFTLLPSALQVGLARFVRVPALGFLVKVSLGFDLITDWGPLWQLAAANPWFDTTFHWWVLAGVARLITVVIGAVLASVVVQSAVILVGACMVYLALVILVGGVPGDARALPASAEA